GVYGTIMHFVTMIPSVPSTYQQYELNIADPGPKCLKSKEKREKWFDHTSADQHSC
ncbi:hypothetical protein BD309DRAFT_877092, partial [Dichomitus squalens]